jgi:CsoR family transcriptional regulator, copper-sensing transcriptional repressor
MMKMDKITHRCESDKQDLNNRLKKIEGQVRGLQKMIEDDRYCIDVLVQISAVTAGLKRVGFQLMENHTHHCVADAIKSGDGEASIDELMKVIKQFSKS